MATNNDKNDLFAAFEEVKKKAKRDDTNHGDTAEIIWKEYIKAVLETNKNLSWWVKYEERPMLTSTSYLYADWLRSI